MCIWDISSARVDISTTGNCLDNIGRWNGIFGKITTQGCRCKQQPTDHITKYSTSSRVQMRMAVRDTIVCCRVFLSDCIEVFSSRFIQININDSQRFGHFNGDISLFWKVSITKPEELKLRRDIGVTRICPRCQRRYRHLYMGFMH